MWSSSDARLRRILDGQKDTTMPNLRNWNPELDRKLRQLSLENAIGCTETLATRSPALGATLLRVGEGYATYHGPSLFTMPTLGPLNARILLNKILHAKHAATGFLKLGSLHDHRCQFFLNQDSF